MKVKYSPSLSEAGFLIWSKFLDITKEFIMSNAKQKKQEVEVIENEEKSGFFSKALSTAVGIGEIVVISAAVSAGMHFGTELADKALKKKKKK